MPRLVPLAAGAAAAGLVVLAGLAEQPRGAILESGTGRVAAWTRAEATRERQRLAALEELPDELPVDEMPLDGPPEEMPLDGPPEEAVPEDAMDAVPLEDVVPLEEAAPAGRVSEEEGAGKEEQTAAEAAETDDADYEEPFEDDFWRDSAPLTEARSKGYIHAQPNYLDFDHQPVTGMSEDEYLRRVAGADEGLQRNPSGTYVQANEGGVLIEPWRVNKNSYDQRWDADWFDDDDPRE